MVWLFVRLGEFVVGYCGLLVVCDVLWVVRWIVFVWCGLRLCIDSGVLGCGLVVFCFDYVTWFAWLLFCLGILYC